MSTELPPVMGVTEVMALLGKSQATVLRMGRDGVLVGRKLGDGRNSSWAFLGESVQAYVDRLKEVEPAA